MFKKTTSAMVLHKKNLVEDFLEHCFFIKGIKECAVKVYKTHVEVFTSDRNSALSVASYFFSKKMPSNIFFVEEKNKWVTNGVF